jgi:hypothetical protein
MSSRRSFHCWVALPILALVIGTLPGCFMPVIEAGREGAQFAIRDHYRDKADAGDANAQFRMGKSYCCGTGPDFVNSMTVYDTATAIDWFCKAARQQYAPAQLRIGEIYSGKIIRGLHPVERGLALFGTKQTSMTVAWMWADLAAVNGADKAPKLAASIAEKLDANDLAVAERLLENWDSAPCNWKDVFPDTPPPPPSSIPEPATDASPAPAPMPAPAQSSPSPSPPA